MTIDELLRSGSEARVQHLMKRAEAQMAALGTRPDLEAQIAEHRELVFGFTALIDMLYRTETSAGRSMLDTTRTCFMLCLSLLLTGAEL